MAYIASQKLNKKSTETVLETVNLTDLLDGGTISTINSVTVTPNGLTVANEEINTVVIELDGETIEIGKGIQFEASAGTHLTEYSITFNITTSNAEILEFTIPLFVTNSLVDYYGSLASANEYFDLMVNVDDWHEATSGNKLRALIQATRSIDRLNFDGDKTDTEQLLQFPRGGDTVFPDDINFACYEEALQLLVGANPQDQISEMRLVSQAISSAKETYDLSSVPGNIPAGIISHRAWSYLNPYLRDPGEIVISRA